MRPLVGHGAVVWFLVASGGQLGGSRVARLGTRNPRQSALRWFLDSGCRGLRLLTPRANGVPFGGDGPAMHSPLGLDHASKYGPTQGALRQQPTDTSCQLGPRHPALHRPGSDCCATRSAGAVSNGGVAPQALLACGGTAFSLPEPSVILISHVRVGCAWSFGDPGVA